MKKAQDVMKKYNRGEEGISRLLNKKIGEVVTQSSCVA